MQNNHKIILYTTECFKNVSFSKHSRILLRLLLVVSGQQSTVHLCCMELLVIVAITIDEGWVVLSMLSTICIIYDCSRLAKCTIVLEHPVNELCCGVINCARILFIQFFLLAVRVTNFYATVEIANNIVYSMSYAKKLLLICEIDILCYYFSLIISIKHSQ